MRTAVALVCVVLLGSSATVHAFEGPDARELPPFEIAKGISRAGARLRRPASTVTPTSALRG